MGVPETMLKETFGLRPVPVLYPLFVGLWLAIAITGMVTSNRMVHGMLAIAWTTLVLTYLSEAALVLWRG